jgi:hypothetical protein
LAAIAAPAKEAPPRLILFAARATYLSILAGLALPMLLTALPRLFPKFFLVTICTKMMFLYFYIICILYFYFLTV